MCRPRVVRSPCLAEVGSSEVQILWTNNSVALSGICTCLLQYFLFLQLFTFCTIQNLYLCTFALVLQLNQYSYLEYSFSFQVHKVNTWILWCLATPTWSQHFYRIALCGCQTSTVKSSPPIKGLREPFLRSTVDKSALNSASSHLGGRPRNKRRSGCEGPSLGVFHPLELIDRRVTPWWRLRSGWVTCHHWFPATNTNRCATPVVRRSPDAVSVRAHQVMSDVKQNNK